MSDDFMIWKNEDAEKDRMAEEINDLRAKLDAVKAQKDEAATIILEWGDIDGSHHKQWTLDQALRTLLGDDYDETVTEWCMGEDGPHTYEWDEGIAP